MSSLILSSSDADTDQGVLFWSHVDIKGPNDCWEWSLKRNKFGYGYTNWGLAPNKWKMLLCHRVAFMLSGGQLTPEKPQVLHSCNNTPCCNPDHLRAGDITDNMQDRKKAGRGNHPTGDRTGARKHPESLRRGESHHGHKLTEVEVREIRRLFAAGGISKSQLGRDFSVSNPLIGYIVRGQSWAHIV